MGACVSGQKDSPAVQLALSRAASLQPLSMTTASLRRFTLKELSAATSKFHASRLLGAGSFGKVYRGEIADWSGELGQGQRWQVAVKKLDEDSFQGFGEWLAEVLLLGRLDHPNLVRLLGYCAEEDEGLLVYEFMENGSLDAWLFMDESKGSRCLTWEQRTKIAWETASGLAYLHSQNIIHRDLKSCNILLDKDMSAKLTDFGMATSGPDDGETHISTRVMGTMGYLDPKYMETGHLTSKSDIYAFGVILLELLTGRPPMGTGGVDFLTRWVRPHISNRRPDLGVIMDSRLEGQYSRTGAQKLAVVARNCVDEDPFARPQMQDMLKTLKVIAESPWEDASRSSRAVLGKQLSERGKEPGTGEALREAKQQRSRSMQHVQQQRASRPRQPQIMSEQLPVTNGA